jgi:ketosteroid isomerase-like protein
MSSGNVEAVRRGLAMFESADVEGGLRLLCSDAEWDVSEMPGGGIYRGHDDIGAYWEHLYSDVWERMAMVIEEIVDGGDTVVALVRFQALGRGSGAPVDVPVAWVVRFRDGCMKSVKFSFDREDAVQSVR